MDDRLRVPIDACAASGESTDRSIHPAAHSVRLRVFRLLEPFIGDDHASHIVDLALVALILLNVIAILVESVETFRVSHAQSLAWFENFSVAIFSIEYLCRVWACVENGNLKGRTDFRRRLRYVVSPGALVDLIAVLPFYLALFGLFGGMDTRIVRAVRLLRLFKLTRYAGPVGLILLVLRENIRNLAATIGLLVIIIILAASGIYVLERDVQPDEFGSIPEAMWWAFATLTTVGYGDVTPVTGWGKAFGALITVLSLGIFALPAGLLASSFVERLRQRSESYRYLADRAAADGVVTDAESAELERERVALGLGRDLAATIVLDEQRRRTTEYRCPHCGGRLTT